MATDEELDADFGNVLRDTRRDRGFSQEQLALACGRHRTYISLLERGHNSPSLQTIFMIAEALDVRPSELIAKLESERGKGRKS